MRHGLSPKYVLDEMEGYEVKALMKYENNKKKDEWEQARLISYIIAQGNSTKKLKMDDIVKFYWEQESEQTETSIQRQDIERLRQRAQAYIKEQNAQKEWQT